MPRASKIPFGVHAFSWYDRLMILRGHRHSGGARIGGHVRSAFLVTAALIAALGLSCGGDGSPGASGVDCETYRFDKAAWEADSDRLGPDELTDRQRIADDLIRCRTLRGRTKREVRAMLAPPVLSESNRRMWLWVLGAERGPIKTRPETFQVRFTPDGHVRAARLSD